MIILDMTFLDIEHHLQLLRDTTFNFLEKKEEVAILKKRWKHLLKKRYPQELPLPQAYLKLLAYLLDTPFDTSLSLIEQMANGATLLGRIGEGHQVPELTRLAELGSLWMILGICLQNEALAYAGVRVAIWQTHTLDHRGSPHLSMWGHPFLSTPSRLSAYNILLFSLAYRLTQKKGFQQAIELQAHPPLPYTLALLKLAIPQKPLSYNTPFSLLSEEMTLGCLKFTTPQSSIACTVSGWNSGLFSFHKKEIGIVNSGPHSSGYDSLDSFGIERPCYFHQRGFRELLWEKGRDHFRLKGWTKIFSLPTWMQVEYIFQFPQLTLNFFIQENFPQGRLKIVFYSCCETIEVKEEKILEKGSLQKYRGPSVPVTLVGTETTLTLLPQMKKEWGEERQEENQMEILPLEGKDHFFGANFIIAFLVEMNSPFLSFIIK